MKTKFWKWKPCTNEQAIEHADAAVHGIWTGQKRSLRYTVEYNSYKGYWIASYVWGGQLVLCRGDFDECVTTAEEFFGSSGPGSTLMLINPPHVPEGFEVYDWDTYQAALPWQQRCDYEGGTSNVHSFRHQLRQGWVSKRLTDKAFLSADSWEAWNKM